jgi:ParB-like chromosome segregation protein Spo0J
MKLRCDDILATDATQVRVKLSKETIDQYCEEIKTGAIFPPIDVFSEENSERNILADGHHRLYAHVHAGLEEIEVTMHVGDKHEALKFALMANRSHGLRMSNADKVASVKMALADTELAQLSQREIGDICGVTREAVNRISRRDTLDIAAAVDSEPEEPEENTAENVRPTKPEPTQEEVERGEIRQAMSLIKALPYAGEDTGKLEFTPDDIADLEYSSSWCAHAVLAYRNPG